MKLTNTKLIRFGATLVLTAGLFGTYATATENPEAAPINKDQVNGRVEEAKGTAKEVTGKILDDKGMEIEGNIQKNMGKIQSGYGDLKKDIQDGK